MKRRTSAPRLGGARAIFRPFTLFLAATVIGAVACDAGSTTGPHDDGPTSGTVQLKLIEQIPVPVRIYHGPWVDHQTGRNINIYAINVNNGTLTLGDDGTFELLFDMWFNRDGQTQTDTRRLRGSYEILGSDIRFRFPNSGDSWGTVDQGVIALSLNLGGTGNFYTYSFGR